MLRALKSPDPVDLYFFLQIISTPEMFLRLLDGELFQSVLVTRPEKDVVTVTIPAHVNEPDMAVTAYIDHEEDRLRFSCEVEEIDHGYPMLAAYLSHTTFHRDGTFDETFDARCPPMVALCGMLAAIHLLPDVPKERLAKTFHALLKEKCDGLIHVTK